MHSKAIPRGGGLSFVITFVIFLIYYCFEEKNNYEAILLLFGTISISFISLLDDYKNVNAKIRLISHLFISILSLILIINLAENKNLVLNFDKNIISFLFVSLCLVWCTNLFNFMDGINGLVSLETIFILLSIFFLKYYFLGQQEFILIALMGSVLGFLLWNFPKAKIFMGDVGSCFIGLTLGILLVNSTFNEKNLFWVNLF